MNYQKILILILFTVIFGLGFFVSVSSVQAATFADCPTRYGTLVCGVGEQYCGTCTTGISDNRVPQWNLSCGTCTWSCPAPNVACGATCGAAYVGEAQACIDKKVTTNQCGTCTTTCRNPSTDTYCPATTSCVTRTTCKFGTIWNGCACVDIPYVLASPVSAQPAYINITGNNTVGGDTYLSSNKSVRVDGSGVTTFNFGNWGTGATGFNLNINGNLKVVNNVAFGGYNIDQTISVTAPAIFTDQLAVGVGVTGGLKGAGTINAKQLCIEGNCKATWPTGGGTDLWQANGVNIFYNAGFVGIGTNNPTGDLHIKGVNTYAILHLTDSTTGDTITDGLDLQIVNGEARLRNREVTDMVFYTNNSEVMRMLANGDVNIGDISGSIVNVKGAIKVSGTADVTGVVEISAASATNNNNIGLLVNSPANANVWLDRNSNVQTGYTVYQTNGVTNWYTGINSQSNNNYRITQTFSAANDPAFVIQDGTGNVAIGKNAPARKLDISDAGSGPIVALAGLTTNYRGLSLRQSSNDVENWFAGANNANNFTIRRAGAVDSLLIDATDTVSVAKVKITGGTPSAGEVLTAEDTTGLASWQPATGGGSGAWTQTGNNLYPTNIASHVGIGTTNPSVYPLKVVASDNGWPALFQSTGSNKSIVSIRVAYQGTPSFPDIGAADPQISFGDDDTRDNGLGRNFWSMGVDNSDANKFKISTNVNAVLDLNTKLTLDTSGNLGLGTSNPSSKLDVVGGNIRTTGALTASSILSNAFYGATGDPDEMISIGDADDIITIGGQLKIIGGAPGANKVLTSNATGLASWQTPAIGTGDNLGNHTATTNLNMGSNNLYSAAWDNVFLNDSLRLVEGGYLDDDATVDGGFTDDWLRLNGYIEMRSNDDRFGIVLRDRLSTAYLGLTQIGGSSYLADSNTAALNYFIKGDGRNVDVGGNLTVGGINACLQDGTNCPISTGDGYIGEVRNHTAGGNLTMADFNIYGATIVDADTITSISNTEVKVAKNLRAVSNFFIQGPISNDNTTGETDVYVNDWLDLRYGLHNDGTQAAGSVWINDALQVDGGITSNGIAVCLADGTNCPATTSLPTGINGQTLRYNGTALVANSLIYNNGINVGIGTTVEPTQKLTIGTAGAALGLENAAIIQAKNSAGTYENFLYPRWSDNITYLNYGSGGFNIRDNTNTSRMFITSSGNVGIGIGAVTPPSQKLEVAGNIKTTGSLLSLSLYGTSGNPAAAENILIGDAADIITIGGRLKINEGAPGANKVLTSDSNGLASWQAPSGGPWAVVGNDINSSNIGNVTVGTPFALGTQKFNVNGNALINGNVSFPLDKDATISVMGLISSGNGKSLTIAAASAGSSGSGGNLYLKPGLGSGGANGNVIMANLGGNVGIGTTASPTQKLEVVGNILASGNITATGSLISASWLGDLWNSNSSAQVRIDADGNGNDHFNIRNGTNDIVLQVNERGHIINTGGITTGSINLNGGDISLEKRYKACDGNGETSCTCDAGYELFYGGAYCLSDNDRLVKNISSATLTDRYRTWIGQCGYGSGAATDQPVVVRIVCTKINAN